MADSNVVHTALNRLAKWRVLFAGWQLGTRQKGDPECDAVSDHREATLMLRTESNALLALLMKKGVFTDAEWGDALIAEAALQQQDLERRFPGVKATDHGLSFGPAAVEWMKKWKP